MCSVSRSPVARTCLEMCCYAEKMEQESIQSTSQKSSGAAFEELAIRQNVRPVMDFDSLLGRPSVEDESAEEFSAMLREWRREGTGSARPL